MRLLAGLMGLSLLVGSMFVLESPAEAAGQCSAAKGEVAGRHVVLSGNRCSPVATLAKQDRFAEAFRTSDIFSGPKLRYRYYYSRMCSAEEVAKKNCIAISEPTCGSGGYMIVRALLALNGPRKGEMISQESYCDREPARFVPGAEEDVAQVSASEFRKLPIAASIVESQPESFSLRNGHAHMYARSGTQSFNITLFDQNVRIHAIPSGFHWNYGDGDTRILPYSGGPAPDHTFYDETPTSHVYTETGDYQVRLSTRFRGEYSTEGGPWIPIPGVANVPSEPMLMSVWRTKKLLVDSNCIENPKGPACDSPFLDEKP